MANTKIHSFFGHQQKVFTFSNKICKSLIFFRTGFISVRALVIPLINTQFQMSDLDTITIDNLDIF